MLVTLVAAAGWFFTKSALAEFSPYTFLALRFGLAALILLLLSWHQMKALNRQQLVRGFGTGFILGGALLIWILGVASTDSIGEGAFIVSLAVVLVPIVARIIYGVAISLNLVVALLPAVAGLALLALTMSPAGRIDFQFEMTHIWFFLSTIGFAIHVVLTGRYAQNIPYIALTCMQILAIAIVSGVAALLVEDWRSGISEVAWFWLLCSAFIATSLRFALQTKALAKLNPNNAAMVFILEPVWTAILGAWLLSESMSKFQILGCSLIFLALVIYRGSFILKWWQDRKNAT